MLRTTIYVIVLVTVGGCVTPKYGSFVETTPAIEQELARDAARQLLEMFPPARTEFVVPAASEDTGLNRRLATILRGQGYALAEAPSSTDSNERSKDRSSRHNLRYVLDAMGEDDLHRLSLLVDNRRISRVFQFTNDGTAPYGPWSVAE